MKGQNYVLACIRINIKIHKDITCFKVSPTPDAGSIL